MSSRNSGAGQGRQRRRPRGGRSYRSGGERSRRPAPPPRKLGFWDRVKQFFGLGAPAKPATNGRDRRPEEAPRARLREEPAEPRAAREPRSSRQVPKPEAVEVTTPRLYVGNLSYDATESDLFDLFGGVGKVENVEIISNKHTQRSKGFGFVQMSNVTDAKRAVEDLHDKDYMGRKLVVSGAKLPGDRAEASRGEDRAEESASAAGELPAEQEQG